MQETVIKYAEVLSKVLRVDIEIVDENLYRVAGTGKFAEKINENMGQEGHVYKEVMRSGKEQLVMDPGEHPICKFCSKQGNCDETFENSMPIKVDDRVIGVIGLVCFTEEQRKHILDNLNIFGEFLGQISDLISSKAKEELEKNKILDMISLLNNIIERVDQGIIIVDGDRQIINLNHMAMKILGLENSPLSIESITRTGQEILGLCEYELKVSNRTYTILGEEQEIKNNPKNIYRVYIFTDISTLENMSASISLTREHMDLDYIVGSSKELIKVKDKIKRISLSGSTALIRGESGTGKELFARAIHMESSRRDNAFVAINCAAIPDALLESELFGYVKGAFTGADPKGKVGKIEFANGGTLFLDEIGDMPLYLQTKLLRVLEEREVERLGGNRSIPVDIRVIAATNKDLEGLIEEKLFREDLYYRLNVVPINIPPLREREGDIKILTYFFAEKYSKLFKKKNVSFSEEVWDYFSKYRWPGNVRELQNVVEYIMNMVEDRGLIGLENLPKNILDMDQGLEPERKKTLSLEEMERAYIEEALALYEDNKEGKKKAADDLGIGIATLYRKLKKYELK